MSNTITNFSMPIDMFTFSKYLMNETMKSYSKLLLSTNSFNFRVMFDQKLFVKYEKAPLNFQIKILVYPYEKSMPHFRICTKLNF